MGLGFWSKATPHYVRDGQCDFRVMGRNHVSMHDLEEDMRLSAHTDDLSGIECTWSNDGDISSSRNSLTHMVHLTY